MMPELHFNQAQLQKLLMESLPEREENAIANHLSDCADCRREFEVLAADTDWWSEATERLCRSAARRFPNSRFGLSHDDEAFSFSTDFAVDFLEPSDDADALGRLGEYEIREVIGHGGMGVVLKGFQQELHRHVAVKVLSPHLATSGAARRRFAREAQATAAVVHPHVMAIHSVNASAKLPYLVMPFVDCQSLQERIDQQGPLGLKEILRIGMQTALGLAAAHDQGLVHRDVKPANILLETNVDRVLLTDFGLARAVDDATLTRTGIIAGTPQYMSPEQANGDAVDRRSDLFSLGGVLYAMCTGRPPFRAETTFGVLRRIRETAPRPIREINPDIPVWLERIIFRLLAKEPAQRFDSAEEIAGLLEQCLAHVQQPTSVSLPTKSGDWNLLEGGAKPSKLFSNGIRGLSGKLGLIAGITVITAGVAALRMNFNPPVSERRADLISDIAKSPKSESMSAIPDWNANHNEINQTSDLIDLLESTINDDSAADDVDPVKPL